jgi:hypothetical protein
MGPLHLEHASDWMLPEKLQSLPTSELFEISGHPDHGRFSFLRFLKAVANVHAVTSAGRGLSNK